MLALPDNLRANTKSQPAPRFKHVMSDESHSVGSVLAIHQDSFGFMWIAGKAGLARYDGYEYVFYNHDPDDPNTLSNAVIWDIEEDDTGNLWLATEGGLNYFDRSTETFTSYQHNPNNPDSIIGNAVSFIYVDRQNNFWVGTTSGLDLFHRKTQKFEHISSNIAGPYVSDMIQDDNSIYYIATGYGFKVWDKDNDKLEIYTNDPNDFNSLKINLCRSVELGVNNDVWIGTEVGLHNFDPLTKKMKFYPFPSPNSNIIPRTAIWDIKVDSKGDVWIAGDGGGVSRINKATGKVVPYFQNDRDPSSPLSNVSRSLFEDINGDIWIGHYPFGLSVIPNYNSTFQTHRNKTEDSYSINANTIRGIAEDKDQNLWFGADGGGLNFYNSQSKRYTYYSHDPSDENSPLNNSIQNVIVSSSENIWFGMWNGGVAEFNTKTKTFNHILKDHLLGSSVPNANVTALIESNDGLIYIGSVDGGLNIYNPETKEIELFFHNPVNDESISSNRVWAILQSRSGEIWVGTHEGLDKFNKKTKAFTHYKHLKDDSTSLSNDWVLSLYEDNQNNIWVGTHGGGINKFDVKNEKFTRITKKDGIANNVINAIIQDNEDNIWFSSNKGLTKISAKTNKIRNFTVEDGIQGLIFNRNSVIRTKNGDLIFGGTNGYTRFTPNKIESNKFLPPIKLTRLEINNQIATSKNLALEKNISFASNINLNHNQRIFSIYYAALNYRNTKENKYKYMLEGFDTDWQFVNTKNFSTYTNLNPGTYTFKVQGSNNEGKWSDSIAKIDIHILPPPWRTWWAYTAYILLISIVIIGYILSQRKIINYQKTIVKRLKKIDKSKDEFIASTSHELKTPLFGIIGLAENVLNNSSKELENEDISNINMIISSSKRLATQVQDILDHSSLIDNEIELNLVPTSPYELIKIVATMLLPITDPKKLSLEQDIAEGLPNILVDQFRIQQVLFNIVSNSIKYTKEGKIKIFCSKASSALLKIEIHDSGTGIDSNQLDHLHDPFFQLDEADTRIQGGTGLGLTIANNLINLHGGKLTIKSELGEGTQVSIYLPTTKGNAQSIKIGDNFATRIDSFNSKARLLEKEKNQSLIKNTSLKKRSIQNWTPQKNYTILIVDDEAVNRMVLQGFLKNQSYQIVVAENGEVALDVFEQGIHIDLILLDVMMPGLSGHDVCKKIRKDYSPISLPILFITAKGQVEDLEAAFKSGGNDFIPKPVSRQELLMRVALHLQLYEGNTILENRVKERTKELEVVNKKLEEQNIKDELTGLFNRRFFQQIIDSTIAEANRNTEKLIDRDSTEIPILGFYLIDIDNFKKINDKFGHNAGDEILKQSSERLKHELRESDYMFRWGGEEFLLITKNSFKNHMHLTAERMVNTFSEAKFLLSSGDAIDVTCSIGYCCYPSSFDEHTLKKAEHVIELADRCLYSVKRSGKNAWIGLERAENSLLDVEKISIEENQISKIRVSERLKGKVSHI